MAEMTFGTDYYTIIFFPEMRCLDNLDVGKYEDVEGWYFLKCPIKVDQGIEEHIQRWEVSKDHVEPCPPRRKGLLCPTPDSSVGEVVVSKLRDNGWILKKIDDENFEAFKPPPPTFYL